MRIKTAFVCNSANMSKDNTINALGIITNMVTSELPITISNLTLVMVVEGSKKDTNNNVLKIELSNPSGEKQLSSDEIKFKFLMDKDELRNDIFHTLIVALPNITFTIIGEYKFSVSLNRVNIGHLTLPVNKV